MLKRRVEIDSSSPAEIDGASFRDLLRIAGEKGLIADVEAWFRYRRMRNLTSHAYDRDRALEITAVRCPSLSTPGLCSPRLRLAMSDRPPIDIRPDLWVIVRDILRKHVPGYEVWAFGSRVKGATKPYSDLDLAVISKQPLPLDVLAGLAEDFSESDLPWRVDVVDWAATSESFRKIIERDKVVLIGC
jgi:predicted nucleotidyltransferase